MYIIFTSEVNNSLVGSIMFILRGQPFLLEGSIISLEGSIVKCEVSALLPDEMFDRSQIHVGV